MIKCELISKIFTFHSGASIFISGIEPYTSAENIFQQYDIKVILSVISNVPIPNMNNYGYKHYYYDLEDRPDANLTNILFCTTPIICSSVMNGENILVHCHAGVSRSVSVVIGFLKHWMRCHQNLFQPQIESSDTEDILKFIRLRRACANPNPGFVKQLL